MNHGMNYVMSYVMNYVKHVRTEGAVIPSKKIPDTEIQNDFVY